MSTSTAPSPDRASRPRPGRRPASLRPLQAGYWILILLLVGVNVRWLWQEWATVDMKTIDVLIARGKADEAERGLEARLRRFGLDGEARMKLARLLANRKDYLGCARELHEVPYWWPARAEASFLEGEAYKLIDRAPDAEAAWASCVAPDPLHPVQAKYSGRAARELIGFYMLEGRFAEVRATVWKAYDAADPSERADILAMRLRAELERISHEEALTKLRRFVAVVPDDWQARRALAVEELAAGDAGAAEREIQECLRTHPDEPSVWRTWLDLLSERGDRDGIRAAVAKLPPASDGDAETWKHRGLVRQWDGDLEGAAEAFRRAVALNPREGDYYYKLGMAEQYLGHPERARPHVQKSVQIRESYSKLHDAYYDYVEATRRARGDDPAVRTALEKVATLCRELGWDREAEALLLTLPGG